MTTIIKNPYKKGSLAHTIFDTIKTDLIDAQEGERTTEDLLKIIVAELDKILKKHNLNNIDVRSHLI